MIIRRESCSFSQTGVAASSATEQLRFSVCCHPFTQLLELQSRKPAIMWVQIHKREKGKQPPMPDLESTIASLAYGRVHSGFPSTIKETAKLITMDLLGVMA